MSTTLWLRFCRNAIIKKWEVKQSLIQFTSMNDDDMHHYAAHHNTFSMTMFIVIIAVNWLTNFWLILLVF